jgi:hypothetical protein
VQHPRPASSRYRPDTCVGGEQVREIISNVRNYLLDRLDELLGRLDAFRYRAERRFPRADLRIAYALVLGALLGMGVLAATTVARSDPETTYVAQPRAARVSSSSGSEVVTETVKRPGRTVRLVRTTRLVRERPGTTVRDVVTPPARTIRETHTVTTREVATVTAIEQVTVTVIETVTCKPKDC